VKLSAITDTIIRRGVEIPCPLSVEIGSDIDPDRISGSRVRIQTGCRLWGKDTFIAPGARIGTEGPVTLDSCFVGPGVELKSGYFKKAVFLEKASLGSASHVREGTILEEQASTAHCVGLKQTILLSFVTLGSLINFCDCLMTGGTSRRDHSEVGSSFIHFNFTPNQDKATPSLIGDVPRGVMLDQRPIFLGGQGGLVGPCRIAFGTVSAAGTIVRKDQSQPDHLVFGGTGKGGRIPWKPGQIGISKRILENNRLYIANLFALREWYRHVRKAFISEFFPEALWKGLIATLDLGLDERLRRLHDYVAKLGDSEHRQSIDRFIERLSDRDRDRGDFDQRDAFLKHLLVTRGVQGGYIDTIKGLEAKYRSIGTQWLQTIVESVAS
jgi:UDP-N-acetylglucosamine/UDP-N-acetylgalactosamine diphosphorylase